MRTEIAKIALLEINRQTVLHFQDVTSDIDLFETAVTEYDGVIIQLLFPNPTAGYRKYQLLKTDIRLAEPTSYFTGKNGKSDLTIQEVIELTNRYVSEQEARFKDRYPGLS